MFGYPCQVNSVTVVVHFLWGPYSLFSVHSRLHSPPSPISGAPAVHQSGSEAPSISQIHLCSDWITTQSLPLLPPPPPNKPKYTNASIDTRFYKCPHTQIWAPQTPNRYKTYKYIHPSQLWGQNPNSLFNTGYLKWIYMANSVGQ